MNEKQIWMEGHYAGLAAAAIAEMATNGHIPNTNAAFKEAMKLCLRAPRTLDGKTADDMYDLWRAECYERLVEEYEQEAAEDGEG